MSYRRTIPRDLFNEASLLKCLGQLYLKLEEIGMEECLTHLDEHNGFQVEQDQSDGSITSLTVMLKIRGEIVWLDRPLNSREPYPLRAKPSTNDDEEITVFDEHGKLSTEMLAFLKRDRD